MLTRGQAPWLQCFDDRWIDAVRRMPIADFLQACTEESRRRGLITGGEKPLSFVPHEQLPKGVAYESWVALTGSVPTRDNLHDRFNALIWLSAPHTKTKLNALQSTALKASALKPDRRGSLRDAATIWDENLAVIAASGQLDELTRALRAHDWQTLFIDRRDGWATQWQVFIFGHALLEKLETPFKSITAHVVVVPMENCLDATNWPLVDERLTLRLDDAWTPSMFYHLPVFGIPGWHLNNDDPRFYDDPQVFRPARR